MTSFFDSINLLALDRGKICVGLDPQPKVLSAWGLDDSIKSVETMCRTVVEHLGGLVVAFKPQSGFFEPYGSAGIKVLESVLADIRQAGALAILDVKRGDIGSTMSGYANAYLSPGSPLEADAITLSPFLGFNSLRPAFDLAKAFDKGVYVLARTSNPEGAEIQLAKPDESESISQLIIDNATKENSITGSNYIGLVVGATHNELKCNLANFNGSILAPGIGAQGGKMSDIVRLFSPVAENVLPAVSRQILTVGPDKTNLRSAVSKLLNR